MAFRVGAAPSFSVSSLSAQRVDAEPQSGRRRAVLEDVTEVGSAAVARDLDARLGRLAVIPGVVDGLLGRGTPEAGPAGARVELVPGVEQLGPAAHAEERALEVAGAQYLPEKAFSVAFMRVTMNCSGVSSFRHSSGVLKTCSGSRVSGGSPTEPWTLTESAFEDSSWVGRGPGDPSRDPASGPARSSNRSRRLLPATAGIDRSKIVSLPRFLGGRVQHREVRLCAWWAALTVRLLVSKNAPSLALQACEKQYS